MENLSISLNQLLVLGPSQNSKFVEHVVNRHENHNFKDFSCLYIRDR